MKRGSIPVVLVAALAAGAACRGPVARPEPMPTAPDGATGVVFHDENENGVRDPGERGLPGVAVSNGREVARTGSDGRFALPIEDESILFVVKPRDWIPPLDRNGLPRFAYVHKPAGSPEGLAYPGVAPTGPLPASVDFPLLPRPEPDAFEAIVFGDPQPYDEEELDFFAHDVVEELIGSDALFGLSLGDLVGDDLSLFDPLNAVTGRIGVPWYNVHGNHDMNFRADSDRHADETFERVYGPATYAFEVGPVHFLVLDDVVYEGFRAAEGVRGSYRGGFTERDLAFVRSYLAGVPRDHLVVLAMHIPLAGPIAVPDEERRALLSALGDRPHTLSLSAHTHFQAHYFLGREEGFEGPSPHHHANVGTTSGSWWLGALDEVGIPHATMRCGAPNGYTLARFDGHDYRLRFKAARRPADHQMNVFFPDGVGAGEAADAEVVVNVFAGSERTGVEVRVAGRETWTALERVAREDPAYATARAREEALPARRDGFRLPPAIPSPHLWAGRLPEAPPPGTSTLEVRAEDGFGQVFTARRLIRVE